MWNNNIGNYKAIAGGNTDWTYLKCWEMVRSVPAHWRNDPRITIEEALASDGRHKVWFGPDHPACCFMSFPTLADGAARYLQRLIDRFSHPSDRGKGDAWYWAVQGNIPAFTAALHSHGYFTADPAHYAKLTTSCHKRILGMNLDWGKCATWDPVEPEPMKIIHPHFYDTPGESEPDDQS